MPGFNCAQHGRTGIADVCSHIAESIPTGQLTEKIITLFVDYGKFLGDPEMPLLFKYFYCSICAEKYGLPVEDAEWSGDKFDSMPEMDFVATCAKCFTEALARSGVVIGIMSRAH